MRISSGRVSIPVVPAAEAQLALTLRLIAGLQTPEIARAFRVPEATIAQRLVRAKRGVRRPRPRTTQPSPPAPTAPSGPSSSTGETVFNRTGRGPRSPAAEEVPFRLGRYRIR